MAEAKYIQFKAATFWGVFRHR